MKKINILGIGITIVGLIIVHIGKMNRCNMALCRDGEVPYFIEIAI